MAKNVASSTDKNILAELAYYKWGGAYCCARCGNDTYMDGKKSHSRRCKLCKYDESLTKNTALEGLRFPVTKAYDILSKIHSRAVINFDTKCIPIKGGEIISPIEYIDKYEKLGVDQATIGNNLLKFQRRYRPSIRAISKEFQVEENSIAKLLEKVNARISLYDVDEEENSYLRLKSFMQKMSHRPFSYFLSMLMVPLIGKWQYGEISLGPSRYAIEYDRYDERWHIIKIVLSEVEDYVYTDEPLYKRNRVNSSAIKYGNDQWKHLFINGNHKKQVI